MEAERTYKLGERVAYTPDPRIIGTVVGYGVVYNAHDPQAADDNEHHVVIVRLDEPNRIPDGGVQLNFHVPIIPNILTVLP